MDGRKALEGGTLLFHVCLDCCVPCMLIIIIWKGVAPATTATTATTTTATTAAIKSKKTQLEFEMKRIHPCLLVDARSFAEIRIEPGFALLCPPATVEFVWAFIVQNLDEVQISRCGCCCCCCCRCCCCCAKNLSLRKMSSTGCSAMRREI